MILNGAKYLGDDGVVLQESKNDCGVSVLKMIFNFYKLNISLDKIKEKILNKNGSNMLAIKKMAENNGLKVFAFRMGIEDLKKIKGPAVLHFKRDHFVVLETVLKGEIIILDPAIGRLSISLENFSKIWTGKILKFKK